MVHSPSSLTLMEPAPHSSPHRHCAGESVCTSVHGTLSSNIAVQQFLTESRACRASQVVLAVKSPPANAGDRRHVGSIPGSGRSPVERYGRPLQYSCLENPMDRGAPRTDYSPQGCQGSDMTEGT